jgi:hypothetical protein
VESGLERRIDELEEASSRTPFVPSLNREWLSDEELPPAAVRNDAVGSLSPPIRSPSPPPSSPIPPDPAPHCPRVAFLQREISIP